MPAYQQNLMLLQLCLLLRATAREIVFIPEEVYDCRPWLVGGAVRDDLIGRHPKDFDIALSWEPTWASDLLISNGWKVMEAGQRFGVLHVSKDDHTFEIARFRNDGPYADGKPIEVTPGTLESDARRRDFTVNALYLDPFTGEVRDPTGRGLQDIESRTLRFVGKPRERLLDEDPMRIFRFYRMITKGFTPLPQHLRDVRTYFPECYKRLAERNHAESVREELEKLVGL